MNAWYTAGTKHKARRMIGPLFASALLLSSMLLWAPPPAGAQRNQRIIAVLNVLEKSALQYQRACQEGDQMSCQVLPMAISIWESAQQSTRDCLDGDQEECEMLEQAASLLESQSGQADRGLFSGGFSRPQQGFSGGGSAPSCEEAQTRYNTCMAQVPRLSDEIRSGIRRSTPAARAGARAACQELLAPCQRGVEGMRDIGSERSPAPTAPNPQPGGVTRNPYDQKNYERGPIGNPYDWRNYPEYDTSRPIGNPYDQKNYERDIVIGNPYDWRNHGKIK